MAKRYKAVLFAPDGDWVTDYRDSESIEAVWERLADQGSRWFFYPYHAVIIDHGALTTATQRIVDAPEVFDFDELKGRTIRTFGRFLADLPLSTHEAILS